MENTTISPINAIDGLLLDMSCKLDKAQSIYQLWGDNIGMTKTEFTKTDACYYWYAHKTNTNLYYAVLDYLFSCAEDMENVTKLVQEIRKQRTTTD